MQFAVDTESIGNRYNQIRRATEALVEPLSPEDCQVQSMPDASPAKWHLAHTAWFFETFLLVPQLDSWQVASPLFEHLFNSYYEGVGSPFDRPARGLLSRPSLEEVMAYRHSVDAGMQQLMRQSHLSEQVLQLAELGLHHEQQHQELLLTDIKHALFQNPLRPAYRADLGVTPPAAATADTDWVSFEGGLVEIGAGNQGFAFDNECPRHRVFLEPFRIARKPVSNAQYQAFVEDGGYQCHQHWLADGWNWVRTEQRQAPLYWEKRRGQWHEYSLAGMRPLHPGAPVVHLNYYEATAYAHWAGARLPTECEWEHASTVLRNDAVNDAGAGVYHPLPARGDHSQMLGDVWEWTRSAYLPYPGFAPFEGNAGEYNGKFMSGQFVLRGGSCATPAGHLRPTYRNFFYPHQSWQFSGLRLAEDAD